MSFTDYALTRTCSSGQPAHDTIVDQNSGMRVNSDGSAVITVSFRDGGSRLFCMANYEGTFKNQKFEAKSTKVFCSDGKMNVGPGFEISFQAAGDSFTYEVGGFEKGGSCEPGETLTLKFSPSP